MRSLLWILTLSVVVTACAGPSTVPSAQDARPPNPGQIKTLVLAQINAVKSYSPWDFSNTSGGGTTLTEIHTMGLTVQDNGGNQAPRIATKMPSVNDGSISIPADGRMVTTWQIRPDVTWQDGTPFTTEDIAFTFAMYSRPDLSLNSSASRFMERVDVMDQFTARITWKTTYYLALDLNQSAFWMFPKHLLGEGLEESNAALTQRSYFTTDYIHLGPFRVTSWGQGENQVFERHPGYFLGTPKLDRVIIKTIVNPLSIQTELKAGSIDMAAEKTLPTDAYADLRDEWSKSGEGTVLSRQDNWRYIRFQFDPAFARPIELSQDVRLRRGLLLGWDREALRELIFPGFDRSLTNGDTFMQSSDPRAAIVGEPFAPFPYDSNRAAQELAGGGWTRAADGRLLNREGQQVQIEIRATPAEAKDLAVVAEGWRRLGAEVIEYVPPEALNRENAFKSQFPATNATAQGSGDGIFVGFDSRQSAVADSNWIGNNRGHYMNPALDRLIDQLSASLDITEQAHILRQEADILAADLPALPAYFRLSSTSIRKTVRGPIYEDFPATQGSGNTIARNAHLWDKA